TAPSLGDKPLSVAFTVSGVPSENPGDTGNPPAENPDDTGTTPGGSDAGSSPDAAAGGSLLDASSPLLGYVVLLLAAGVGVFSASVRRLAV
ncbi:MAG: hypothetical protein LBC29_01850, partial [Propionibacteriaceae bacterium]|nr:hypothetical protein [Propionibacteriaceae bacterium]